MLLGVQYPRVRICPRYTRTEGEDAAFLSASYGLAPDQWQSTVVDDTLAVRVSDGRWASSRVGWSVPRQNGKNVALEIIELYKMVILGRKILHTAHEIKTARKAFQRIVGFFESRAFPELGAMVKEIRRTNGQEAIFLHAPGCDQLPRCGCDWGAIEFIARSKGSGRGFTVDDLVMDEAQELDEVSYAALLFTISASPSGNPQQIICGTPPGPKDNGEVFTRLRKDAMSGKSRRTCWLEWSFDPDADLDDRSQWAQANPALGLRLDWEQVEDERAGTDDVTFQRERGGVWAADSTRKVIPDAVWRDLYDEHSQPGAALAMGIDQTPEGDVTALAVASRRDDDHWHVELVEHKEGAGWVPERVKQIIDRNPGFRAVVIDRASPAASLVEDLRAKGVIVTVTSASDMGQACVSFLRVVNEDMLRHVGQPQLASSMSLARKRTIGTEGLWGWGRAVSAADISPTVAVTLALWGAMSTTAKHQLRQRSGRAVFAGAVNAGMIGGGTPDAPVDLMTGPGIRRRQVREGTRR